MLYRRQNEVFPSVNLLANEGHLTQSAYEKDRIVPDELGKTELGRDMLAQDYILKQLTASLIYPEKQLGKTFWDKVYAKAKYMYGSTEIPINTFNKVWIVAGKAKVLERNNTVYVVGSHLKVMLEEDYMAMNKNTVFPAKAGIQKRIDFDLDPRLRGDDNNVASKIIREVILPEIEKEVNQGQNFAPLRQMFYSMILASWYKLALKDALLNQVYSNKAKTGGVLSADPTVKEKIYEQYLRAYKKGVFNYIKDDLDVVSKQLVPRKYFSGGLALGIPKILDRAQTATPEEINSMGDDLAIARVNMTKKEADSAMMDKQIEGIGNVARSLLGFVDSFNVRPLIQHALNLEDASNMLEIAFKGNNAGWMKSAFLTLAMYGDVTVLEKLKEKVQEMKPTSGIFNENVLVQQSYPRLKYALGAIEGLEQRLGVPASQKFNAEWVTEADAERLYRTLRGKLTKGQEFIETVWGKENLASLFYLGASDLNATTSDGKISRDSVNLDPIQLFSDHVGLTIPYAGETRAVVFDHDGFKFFVKRLSMRDLSKAQKLVKLADEAMVTLKQGAEPYNGGIDLNAKNMGLDVAKEGQGVEMKFDPAMVAEFQRGDFSGIVPVIIRITPISSALPILGL